MSLATADVATAAWQDLRSELVRFVTARVGDGATAEDIVHDVLLRALRALRGSEPPHQLRAWLYRSVRNALIDHYRSRRSTAALSEGLPVGLPETDEPAARELASCLAPLLRTLRPPYRRALELAEVDGLPQKEIAQREGISLSGAKSRVQRARQMLRNAFLACCRVELDGVGGVLDCERHDASMCCDCR